MGTISDELAEKIKSLPDIEKIQLVDSILMQLDRPDPEIDRIWADQAPRRISSQDLPVVLHKTWLICLLRGELPGENKMAS